MVVCGEDEVGVDEVHHSLTELPVEREDGHVGHGHHDLGGEQLGGFECEVVRAVLREARHGHDVNVGVAGVDRLHGAEVLVKPVHLHYSDGVHSLPAYVIVPGDVDHLDGLCPRVY